MQHLSISPFPPGVITAVVTPMTAALAPDQRILGAHCRSVLAAGSNGIVLLGTTGEANSFSVEERILILEGVLSEGIAPGLIMVGTGCCAITDTIQLTRHAISCGVRHILMLPPFYYKPVSDNALYQYFSQVIDTVHSPFHLYLYHFPKLTGLDLSIPLISRLMHMYPGILQGIKDSGGDIAHMLEIIRTLPDLHLYSGTEAYLSDILKAGGAGCISATCNITAQHAAAVFEAFRRGMDTDALQQKLTALRDILEGHGIVGAIKGYLALASGDNAWNHVRPPNTIPAMAHLQRMLESYASESAT